MFESFLSAILCTLWNSRHSLFPVSQIQHSAILKLSFRERQAHCNETMLAYKWHELGLEKSTTHCFEFLWLTKLYCCPNIGLIYTSLSNCFVSFKTKKKISFIFETESQKVKDKGLFERVRNPFETHEMLEEIMCFNKSLGSQGRNDLIRPMKFMRFLWGNVMAKVIVSSILVSEQ